MRKNYRLQANADFQRIRREGSTFAHPILVLSLLPNNLEHSRFGFVVTRRNGCAATRNRIKRRMREAVRLRVRESGVARGWDLVFIARRPSRNASFHRIDQAIGLVLDRAGLAEDSG